MKRRKKLSPERRAEIDRILAEAAEKAARREEVEAVVAEPIRHPVLVRAGASSGIGPQKQTRWNQLAHNAKKASRRPITPVDAVVTKSTCDHCRMPMWTADKKMETTCEDCEFRLITEKHELRQKMERTAGGRLVNPFADNPQPVINTFGAKSDNLI